MPDLMNKQPASSRALHTGGSTCMMHDAVTSNEIIIQNLKASHATTFKDSINHKSEISVQGTIQSKSSYNNIKQASKRKQGFSILFHGRRKGFVILRCLMFTKTRFKKWSLTYVCGPKSDTGYDSFSVHCLVGFHKESNYPQNLVILNDISDDAHPLQLNPERNADVRLCKHFPNLSAAFHRGRSTMHTVLGLKSNCGEYVAKDRTRWF
ncbi:hypothetical protein F2P81_010257 [Scophthalmus maximus]|uniref:Uncharacterized protein n=1 Tax=Scophthalmus maximus TaxID=52904 RepID=A0A6A4STU2_SCOMX|nr:hypothetical protein F2P81_010257 [Scophthalmus maximus]